MRQVHWSDFNQFPDLRVSSLIQLANRPTPAFRISDLAFWAKMISGHVSPFLTPKQSHTPTKPNNKEMIQERQQPIFKKIIHWFPLSLEVCLSLLLYHQKTTCNPNLTKQKKQQEKEEKITFNPFPKTNTSFNTQKKYWNKKNKTSKKHGKSSHFVGFSFTQLRPFVELSPWLPELVSQSRPR